MITATMDMGVGMAPAVARGREEPLRDRALEVSFEREALPHMEALFRFARRLSGNDRDAEDLVQEAYLRAFRFFDRYVPGSNCKSWLFRILHNLQISKWQQKKRRPDTRSLEDTEEYSLYPRLHDPRLALQGNPEIEILARDAAPEVRAALDSLPEEFRTVVLLCDVEEFSYQEIADILEIPIGTVRSRLNRGRTRLQKLLYDYIRRERPDLLGTSRPPAPIVR